MLTKKDLRGLGGGGSCRAPLPAPAHWAESPVGRQCSLHELSPYIGKLKSIIAGDLVQAFSRPGDLVLDPFAGSGTIPLEASRLGRSVLAADVSPYSEVLTRAKLYPPRSMSEGIRRAEIALRSAEELPEPDLRSVPAWVRSFFHPRTLKELMRFGLVCWARRDHFLLSCLLGILHHQRPGFLSYPSSHLVPYLRDQKYPRDSYPEMYEYRELAPRIFAKIRRSLRRNPEAVAPRKRQFRSARIESLTFPQRVDCIITSPPYMNALDYNRDNRLRLWLILAVSQKGKPLVERNTRESFSSAVTALAKKSERRLRRSGFCVLVVGDKVTRRAALHPANDLLDIFCKNAPSLSLVSRVHDLIPDVRRSRRDCRATKLEQVLVFKRG